MNTNEFNIKVRELHEEMKKAAKIADELSSIARRMRSRAKKNLLGAFENPTSVEEGVAALNLNEKADKNYEKILEIERVLGWGTQDLAIFRDDESKILDAEE